MRVLTVTNMWPSPARPASGVFTARQMRSLEDHGVEVDLLFVEGPRSALKAVPVYARAALRVLALNFGRRRYDLIHAHTGHCGLLACLQVRYPVVLSYVGYDINPPAAGAHPRRRLEGAVFRRLSLLVAGSIAKWKRGYEQLPGPGRRRTTVVPNGIDRRLFAPSDRSEARRKLGWDEDRALAMFAADPARSVKRFPLARAAVEAARRKIPELELVVADRVPPDEMPVWMNAADVLILTSSTEGSPNAVKEAMACNLPIVATDVGDVRTMLEGVELCEVCEDDPNALGAALARVLQARPRRSNGRERTASLDLDVIAEQVLGVYERALARRAGPLGFFPRRRPAAQPTAP